MIMCRWLSFPLKWRVINIAVFTSKGLYANILLQCVITNHEHVCRLSLSLIMAAQTSIFKIWWLSTVCLFYCHFRYFCHMSRPRTGQVFPLVIQTQQRCEMWHKKSKSATDFFFAKRGWITSPLQIANSIRCFDSPFFEVWVEYAIDSARQKLHVEFSCL